MKKVLIIAGCLFALVVWIIISGQWLADLSANASFKRDPVEHKVARRGYDEFAVDRPVIKDKDGKESNHIAVVHVANHHRYAYLITIYNAQTRQLTTKTVNISSKKMGFAVSDKAFEIGGDNDGVDIKIEHDLPSTYSMEPLSAHGPIKPGNVLRYFFFHGQPFSKTTSCSVSGSNISTNDLIEICDEKKISGVFVEIIDRSSNG